MKSRTRQGVFPIEPKNVNQENAAKTWTYTVPRDTVVTTTRPGLSASVFSTTENTVLMELNAMEDTVAMTRVPQPIAPAHSLAWQQQAKTTTKPTVQME